MLLCVRASGCRPGCGAGVVAIALALAGADVVAADLPRVTPLARANAAANCRAPPHRIQVGAGLGLGAAG
jgi:methylase of polypeptide subunit release factors